ncbi:MAG: hypothetical protein SCJ93_07030, partial [Bacillota bacterium]|nr:hypothetical protein [Bacillota bacterium]
MKFKFKVIFILILTLSLVIFTSCSQGEEDVPEESEGSLENTSPQEDEEEPVEEVEEPQESESNDNEEITNGDEPVSSETQEPNEEEIKIDSGTYVGLIDGNHIEIKISGVPEEMASKVFIVDEDVKSIIEEEIVTEDQVKFEYYLNEDDVGVIT